MSLKLKIFLNKYIEKTFLNIFIDKVDDATGIFFDYSLKYFCSRAYNKTYVVTLFMFMLRCACIDITSDICGKVV